MGERVGGRLVAAILILACLACAEQVPEGYFTEGQSSAILEKALHVHVDPNLDRLSPNERQAVSSMIEVGRIFQRLYETSRDPGSQEALARLTEMHHESEGSRATQNLLTMYYLFKGPIATTLDNERVPFLPVEPRAPGGSLYPDGATKDEIDAHLEQFPEDRDGILGVRTVVRRCDRAPLRADIRTLRSHPVIDGLHPGLRERLNELVDDDGGRTFYAVPYAVAFADDMVRAHALLSEASALLEDSDPEFAGYLANRARDLLSNDYESGDASWVTGHFGNLNAQIGAYEVYDDNLYGVKAFFGFNVLLRDREASDALRAAIKGMQSFENSLPYEPEGYDGGNKKTVREDIPVGVYDVVADFGQSRGTNTATILPNSSEHARKYGRTILLRANIMRNEDLFGIRQAAFRAAVAKQHADDLTVDGGFYRTLWHEVGHYLGVDRTRDGRDLDEALETTSSVLEEMKADLVSLFLVKAHHESGYYSDGVRTAVYADGIRRVLLKSKPRRAQAYQTMELMQMNFYLDRGLLEVGKDGRLIIHYHRYHDVVTELLGLVFEAQAAGDPDAAEAFIERWSTWSDDLHGRLAEAMKKTERYRYAYVTYGALDETAQ